MVPSKRFEQNSRLFLLRFGVTFIKVHGTVRVWSFSKRRAPKELSDFVRERGGVRRAIFHAWNVT